MGRAYYITRKLQLGETMKLRIQERFSKEDFGFGWGRHNNMDHNVKWKFILIPTCSLEHWRNGWCVEAAWGLWAVWAEYENGAKI